MGLFRQKPSNKIEKPYQRLLYLKSFLTQSKLLKQLRVQGSNTSESKNKAGSKKSSSPDKTRCFYLILLGGKKSLNRIQKDNCLNSLKK